MGEWRLFDETLSLDYFDDHHPYNIVESEKQLRNELNFWRCQVPSTIRLVSPDDENLSIGIGGLYCGIRWSKPPFRENLKSPMADPMVVSEGIEFKWDGKRDGMSFRPQNILPVLEALPVILLFFKEHRLADWLTWWEFKSQT